MKKRKKNETQEREAYLSQDFGEALGKLEPLAIDLEFPTPTQAISIRLPRDVLNKIRMIADDSDIPYQSLIKMWLVERLKKVA